MRHTSLCIFAIFQMAATSPALSGTSAYHCIVSEELNVDSDGSLKRFPKPLTIGSRFAVDRNTGALVQPDLALWAFGDAQVTVLAKGNASNAFVASYVSDAAGGGVHFTVLRVEEYHDGLQKPFLLASGGDVHSGLCE
jgi:hypothetical protein